MTAGRGQIITAGSQNSLFYSATTNTRQSISTTGKYANQNGVRVPVNHYADIGISNKSTISLALFILIKLLTILLV